MPNVVLSLSWEDTWAEQAFHVLLPNGATCRPEDGHGIPAPDPALVPEIAPLTQYPGLAELNGVLYMCGGGLEGVSQTSTASGLPTKKYVDTYCTKSIYICR